VTPEEALAQEAQERRIVRHWQRYTPEERANRAASHRLGHRQRTALGEFFYTHPDLPGVAFPSPSAVMRRLTR
jgi:hypothetical protein